MPVNHETTFDDAYDRHWLSVFRFALAWTNDWQAAEDLTQGAFLRLWAARDRLDWSAPLLPWLITATRRLATDRYRAIRRQARIWARDQTPALDAESRLRWLDIQSALARLTPIQRAGIVLTSIVGLDTRAVAELLDTTPGGVRAAVSRARMELLRE
jgi:RNA polymerase sigma-70 factor (ECF subfamily)